MRPAASAPAPRTIQESAVRPPDSASSYIARLLHRQSPPASAASAPTPLRATLQPEAFPGISEKRTLEQAAIAPYDESEASFEMLLAAPSLAESLPPPALSPAADSAATSWRRIPLGDDAELLIRDDTYQRKRDRIDWLVGWARKVLG